MLNSVLSDGFNSTWDLRSEYRIFAGNSAEMGSFLAHFQLFFLGCFLNTLIS